MAAIRDAGMQAVSLEIIEFIDIDRSRENRTQQPLLRHFRAFRQDVDHIARLNLPFRLQHLSQLTLR